MIEILESQNVLRRNRFSLISQMKFSELPVSHGGPESAAHGAPHRVSVQKSPAPDSISNFTTDYRTVKRHESCHMTDLKIKNFLVCDAACLIMTTRFKSFSQCWYLIFFQPAQQFLKYFLYPGTPRGLIWLERSSTHGRPWIKGSSTDRV